MSVVDVIEVKSRTLQEWREVVYCESRREFAARLGVHHVALYYWETGKRVPLMRSRRKVADALGVSYDAVLWPEESAEATPSSTARADRGA